MSENRQQQVIPQVVRSQNFCDVYANGMRLRVSPVDFVITLSRTLDVPSPVPVVQDEASIAMPLAFAKILSLHLSMAIEAAESVMGKISIPEANMPGQDFTKNIIDGLKAIKMVS